MPQLIGPSILATLLVTAATAVATQFVSSLLTGGPPKTDATERELKSAKPPRIHILGRRRSHGNSMLFTNTSDSETVDVWAYCEGPVSGVAQVYLNDDKVTISGGVVQPLSDGSYSGSRALAGYNLGENPNVAHAPVVSRVPDWTSDHRGDGIVSGYLVKLSVKAKDFLNVFPQGDNVSMSLAIDGHFCHDPRDPGSDPDDPSTWPFTDNAALLLLWFKMVFLGKDYATAIAPVEQYWIDAANVCDEVQSLDAGGTEPRYRGWIMFPADADPVAVQDQILATFDGWTAEDENGCIKVYAGKLYTPTVSVGWGQIVDYELQEFVEDENRVNEILVRHVSEDHDFNEVEPEAWRDEDDITERGKLVSEPLDLQVPSHTQARRLAKRRMARSNAPQRGKVRVVFSARAALAERYINLTIEESGETFFDGVVEVLGGERDPETGGAVIEWVAVDPDVDDWTPALDDGEPAPSASKFYIPPLETPTIASAIADFNGDDVTLTITANSPYPDRDDLTWLARWRAVGATGWGGDLEFSDIPAGATVQLVTDLVPLDGNVEVQVAYRVGDGRQSDWSDSMQVTTGSITADLTTITVDSINITADRT